MSRTVRVLPDGAVISSGSTPAEIAQGIVAYVQRPSDTDKLTIDWNGFLGSETISSVTWTATNLTVASTTNSAGLTSALISDVPETSHGFLDIKMTSSGGRIKTITVWFYGFNILQPLAFA
jgi:hypothetical protein